MMAESYFMLVINAALRELNNPSQMYCRQVNEEAQCHRSCQQQQISTARTPQATD